MNGLWTVQQNDLCLVLISLIPSLLILFDESSLAPCPLYYLYLQMSFLLSVILFPLYIPQHSSLVCKQTQTQQVSFCIFPVITLMYISFHSLLLSDVDKRGNGRKQHSILLLTVKQGKKKWEDLSLGMQWHIFSYSASKKDASASLTSYLSEFFISHLSYWQKRSW